MGLLSKLTMQMLLQQLMVKPGYQCQELISKQAQARNLARRARTRANQEHREQVNRNLPKMIKGALLRVLPHSRRRRGGRDEQQQEAKPQTTEKQLLKIVVRLRVVGVGRGLRRRRMLRRSR